MGWKSGRMLELYDEPDRAAAQQRLFKVFDRPTPLLAVEKNEGHTGESQGE
jgi:hypothetical protein